MHNDVGAVETGGSIDTAVDGPSFGAYLNDLLLQRNLTPRELATLLGLDLSLVYKWLRGERTPRFNSGHADRIAEALQLPPSERQALNASQVRSLRERPAHRSRPTPRSRFMDAPVDALIERRMILHTGRALTPRSVKGSTMTPAEGAVRGPRAALEAA